MPAPKPEHTGLKRILHSYRWRRRIAVAAVLIFVGGPLIYLGVRYSKGEGNAPLEGKATIVAQPKTVPFRPAEKRKVHRVLARFLATAVARKDLGAAWNVAGPQIRQGMTRKQWDTGAIPVQPYPVSSHGLGQWDQVQYSYRGHVGLEVLLQPKPGSGTAPATADVDVVKTHHGSWVVNYFMPNKFHGNPTPLKTHAVAHKQKRRSLKQRKRASAHAVGAQAMSQEKRQSRVWWALPLSLLALIVLVPLTYGIYTWQRNRRAYDSYMRSRAS